MSGFVFSQVEAETQIENNNRWTFGGGIGLGFGSQNAFYLSASPRVGYRLTDDLEGGVAGSVSWQTSDYYRSTMFGIGPFLNYYIARIFYIRANYQHYLSIIKTNIMKKKLGMQSSFIAL